MTAVGTAFIQSFQVSPLVSSEKWQRKQDCCCFSGVAGPEKGEASDEDDDNEFFDAMEDAPEFITVPADPQFHKSVSLPL